MSMRVVWWLATVVAISLVGITLSERGAFDPVQNLSLTITSPIQGGLRHIASPSSDLFSGILDRGDLVRENKTLKDEVERLNAQLAQRQDAEQRVKELEAALGVKQSRPEDRLLTANV